MASSPLVSYPGAVGGGGKKSLVVVLDFSSPEFFSRPFRLFLAHTNCPWVSEDAFAAARAGVPQRGALRDSGPSGCEGDYLATGSTKTGSTGEENGGEEVILSPFVSTLPPRTDCFWVSENGLWTV